MNHCIDLKFHKPSEKDIKKRIDSICKSENLKIDD
jgi:DNA polymerase III delta prime subunit